MFRQLNVFVGWNFHYQTKNLWLLTAEKVLVEVKVLSFDYTAKIV